MNQTRAELLEAYAELTQTIRASEQWEASYSKSPKHLKALIQQEAKLQASVNGYLLGLRERTPTLVNWSEVKLTASTVPPLSDAAWQAEMRLLYAAVASYILEMTAIGAQAGEAIYAIPLGITSLNADVIEAAGIQTANLVKNVNSTTRDLMRKAIKQSIAQGEDTAALTNRINELVANPIRAELISQTESVTAYQSGLERFAVDSGAKSSTWDALSGACKLCAPLDGVTHKIGTSFTLANGRQVDMPPGHPRCRCGRILNY